MKKIVITYGLIASAISAVMWLIIGSFYKQGGAFENGMLIGYTAMLLSFLFIYFGMASYRDNVGDGYISFPKALQVGFLISLIACTCYVISWAIIYNTMVPDFLDKLAVFEMNKLKESGASPQKMQKLAAQMAEWKENYKNPLWFSLMTFMEPLPVAISVTLVSALLVRIKNKQKTAIAVK
jgi:hypothetical protein